MAVEKAVVAYLEDHLVPLLIGRDPARIEDIWQYLYKGAYWRARPGHNGRYRRDRHGSLGYQGQGCRDCPSISCWAGRAAKPCCVTFMRKARIFPRAVDAVAERMAQGYKAVRAQVGIPGLPEVYGTDKSATNTSDLNNLPHEEVWSTSKYLRHVPRLFESLRDQLGWGRGTPARCPSPIDPNRRRRVWGKTSNPIGCFGWRDVAAAEYQEGFRLIRQHTVTPLAVGEVFNTIWDARLLIEEQLIDFIRTTSVSCGWG